MNDVAGTQSLLADQAGVWEGEYVHLDLNQEVIDRHQSRLVCRFSDGANGEVHLRQTNIYTWASGEREIRYFEGVLRDGRVWIDNDLINGWASAIELDATNRTIMVAWTRAAEPDFRYYEMITVSEDGNAKNRTWHWYRKGRLFQRTVINEEGVEPPLFSASPKAATARLVRSQTRDPSGAVHGQRLRKVASSPSAKAQPGSRLACAHFRTGVGGSPFGLERISRDWQAHDDPSYCQFSPRAQPDHEQ